MSNGLEVMKSKFKEMGLNVPEEMTFGDIKMPFFTKFFWLQGMAHQAKVDEYLYNLDIAKKFRHKNILSDNDMIRWRNIYDKTMEYYFDTAKSNKKSYDENKRNGFLTIPPVGSNVMDSNQIKFFHFKIFDRFPQNFIFWNIIAPVFCPRHEVVSSVLKSGVVYYFVYIKPSKLTKELVLHIKDNKFRILSKSWISKTALKKYLLFSEKNVKYAFEMHS